MSESFRLWTEEDRPPPAFIVRHLRSSPPSPSPPTGVIQIADSNEFFSLYQTLREDLREATELFDESVFFSPTTTTEVDVSSTWSSLRNEIGKFKKSLRAAFDEYKNCLEIYSSIKKNHEQKIRILQSVIPLVDEESDPAVDELGLEIKKNVNEYLKKIENETSIMKAAEDVKNARKKFENHKSISREIKNIHCLPICSVCLEHQVDCILVPCGHTICTFCSRSLFSCHICRAFIKRRQKIYT